MAEVKRLHTWYGGPAGPESMLPSPKTPGGPPEKKAVAMSIRITHKTRDLLEEAAAESCRSLSSEVAVRLERSLRQDKKREKDDLF